MKCIVGLGNIGKRFEQTRHNIGFEVIDFMLEQNRFSLDNYRESGIKKENYLQHGSLYLFVW